MFITCCLFLIIVINSSVADTTGNNCPFPSIAHGRAKIRQRVRLVKFMCNAGYDLVGNKYATCRNGQWDVPMPVCIRPGCKIAHIENGIQMQTRRGAWLVFFCMPGHRLVGSPAIYCDGFKWNDTIPTCVDATAPPKLSCDFEEPGICDWRQDEFHDFDWRRLNKKTPSSFLFTGPSFDHTHGPDGSGYYMYIESTSRTENDSARLLSPVYDGEVSKDGCFSFYYHMFGKSIGGLRVYQKPESYPLQTMLGLTGDDRKKYLLFEKWGNQGDFWYGSVNKLRDFSDNFQIVVEGVRGTSFTSDIAIDDVTILKGEACTVANQTVSTPSPDIAASCSGRCDVIGNLNPEPGCGCTAACVADSDCCSDFFEACVFTGDSLWTPSQEPTINDDIQVPSSINNAPQTEKLVATTTTRTTIKTTPITPKTTLPTTPSKPTTVKTTRTPKTTPRTTVKTTKMSTTTTKQTTAKKITTTRKPITLVFKTTTPPPYNAGKVNITTTNKYKMTTMKATVTTIKPNDGVSRTIENHNTYHELVNKTNKKEKDATMEKNIIKSDQEPTESTSSVKTAAIVIGVLVLLCASVWLGITMRGSQGLSVLARLRATTQRDPEVRFLTRDEELEENSN